MDIVYEYLDAEEIRHDADSDDVFEINWLLNQLITDPRPINRDELAEVCRQSLLLVARVNGVIRGMNTLCVLHLPTGKVGVLEDVVVHENIRGAGVGKELVRRLIRRARAEQIVDRIELTCHPSRERANRLYLSLGFERRETNNYVLKL